MTPPSYMRSVVDRNVVMRRMTVIGLQCDYTRSLLYLTNNMSLPGATQPRMWGVLGEKATLM
jgi:hypothetical protein